MFEIMPYSYFPCQTPFEKMFGSSSSVDDRKSNSMRIRSFDLEGLIKIDPMPCNNVRCEIEDKEDLEPKDIFPKVKRVVFNDPVTKVWFEDGTTSLVKCSETDVFSKDAGLAFAILKRLFGTIDEKNQAQSDGYMCELSRIIKGAYDQKAAGKNPPKKVPGGAKEKPRGAKKISRGKKA